MTSSSKSANSLMNLIQLLALLLVVGIALAVGKAAVSAQNETSTTDVSSSTTTTTETTTIMSSTTAEPTTTVVTTTTTSIPSTTTTTVAETTSTSTTTTETTSTSMESNVSSSTPTTSTSLETSSSTTIQTTTPSTTVATSTTSTTATSSTTSAPTTTTPVATFDPSIVYPMRGYQVDTFGALGVKSLNLSLGRQVSTGNKSKNNVIINSSYNLYDGTEDGPVRRYPVSLTVTTPTPKWVCSNVFTENQMNPSYASTANEKYRDGVSETNPMRNEKMFGLKEWNRTSYVICVSPHWIQVSASSFQLCLDVMSYNRTGFSQVIQQLCPDASLSTLHLPADFAAVQDFANFKKSISIQFSPVPRRNYSESCNFDSLLDTLITVHLESFAPTPAADFYFASFSAQLRVGIPECNFVNISESTPTVSADDASLSASVVALSNFTAREVKNSYPVPPTPSTTFSNSKAELFSSSSSHYKVSSQYLVGKCFDYSNPNNNNENKLGWKSNFGLVSLSVLDSPSSGSSIRLATAAATDSSFSTSIQVQLLVQSASIISLSPAFSAKATNNNDASLLVFAAAVKQSTNSVIVLMCAVSLSDFGCPSSSQPPVSGSARCARASSSPPINLASASSFINVTLQTISPPASALDYDIAFSSVLLHTDSGVSVFTFNPQTLAEEIMSSVSSTNTPIDASSSISISSIPVLASTSPAFVFPPWNIQIGQNNNNNRKLLGVLPDHNEGASSTWSESKDEDISLAYFRTDRILPPVPSYDPSATGTSNQNVGNNTCRSFMILASSSNTNNNNNGNLVTIEIIRLCDGLNVTALAQTQNGDEEKCALYLPLAAQVANANQLRLLAATIRGSKNFLVAPAHELNFVFSLQDTPSLLFLKVIFNPTLATVAVPSTTSKRPLFPTNPDGWHPSLPSQIACAMLVSNLSTASDVAAPPKFPAFDYFSPAFLPIIALRKNSYAGYKVVKVLSATPSYSTCYSSYSINPKWCALNLKLVLNNVNGTKVVVYEGVLQDRLGSFELRHPIFDLTPEWNRTTFNVVPTIPRFFVTFTGSDQAQALVQYFPPEIIINAFSAPWYVNGSTMPGTNITATPYAPCFTGLAGNTICAQNVNSQWFFALFKSAPSSDPMSLLNQYRVNNIAVDKSECASVPQPTLGTDSADTITITCLSFVVSPGKPNLDVGIIFKLDALTGDSITSTQFPAPHSNIFEGQLPLDKKLHSYFLGEDCVVYYAYNLNEVYDADFRSVRTRDRIAIGYSCGSVGQVTWWYTEGPVVGNFYDVNNLLSSPTDLFFSVSEGLPSFGIHFLLNHGFVFYAILDYADRAKIKTFQLSPPPIIPPGSNCTHLNITKYTNLARGGSWEQYRTKTNLSDALTMVWNCDFWNDTLGKNVSKIYITADTIRYNLINATIDRVQLFNKISPEISDDELQRVSAATMDAVSQRVIIFAHDALYGLASDIPGQPAEDLTVSLQWTTANTNNPSNTSRLDSTLCYPFITANFAFALSAYGLLMYADNYCNVRAIDVYSGDVKWNVSSDIFGFYPTELAYPNIQPATSGNSGLIKVFRGVMIFMNQTKGSIMMIRARDGVKVAEMLVPMTVTPPVLLFDHRTISSAWVWGEEVWTTVAQLDIRTDEMFDLEPLQVRLMWPIEGNVWEKSIFSLVRSLRVIPPSWRRYNLYGDWEFVSCSTVFTNVSIAISSPDEYGYSFQYIPDPEDNKYYSVEENLGCFSFNTTRFNLEEFVNSFVSGQHLVATIFDFRVPPNQIDGFFDFVTVPSLSDDAFSVTPRLRVLDLSQNPLIFPAAQQQAICPGFLNHLWQLKFIEQKRESLRQEYFPWMSSEEFTQFETGVDADRYDPFIQVTPTALNVSGCGPKATANVAANYLPCLMRIDFSDTYLAMVLEYPLVGNLQYWAMMQPSLITHLYANNIWVTQYKEDAPPPDPTQHAFFNFFPFLHDIRFRNSHLNGHAVTYNSTVYPKYLRYVDLSHNINFTGPLPSSVWPALEFLDLSYTNMSQNKDVITLEMLFHRAESVSPQFPDGEMLQELHLAGLHNLSIMVSLLDSEVVLRPVLPRLRLLNLSGSKIVGVVDFRQQNVTYSQKLVEQAGFASNPASYDVGTNLNLTVDLRRVTRMKGDPFALQMICPCIDPEYEKYAGFEPQVVGSHHGLWWTHSNGTEEFFTCPLGRPVRFPSWNELRADDFNVSYISAQFIVGTSALPPQPYDKFCAPHTLNDTELEMGVLPNNANYSFFAQDGFYDAATKHDTIVESPKHDMLFVSSNRFQQTRKNGIKVDVCSIPSLWIGYSTGLTWATLNTFAPAITEKLRPCTAAYESLRNASSQDYSVLLFNDMKSWSFCFDAVKQWPQDGPKVTTADPSGATATSSIAYFDPSALCRSGLATFGTDKCTLTAMLKNNLTWHDSCFSSYVGTSPVQINFNINKDTSQGNKLYIQMYQQLHNKIFGCAFDYSPMVLPNNSIFPGYSIYERNRPCLALFGSQESFTDLSFNPSSNLAEPPTIILSVLDSTSGSITQRPFLNSQCFLFPDLKEKICNDTGVQVPTGIPSGGLSEEYSQVRYSQWPSTWISADARAILWQGCGADSKHPVGYANVGLCYPLSRLYPQTFNVPSNGINTTTDAAACLSSCSVENEWLSDPAMAQLTFMNCSQIAGKLSAASRCLLGTTQRHPDLVSRAMIDDAMTAFSRNERGLMCMNGTAVTDVFHGFELDTPTPDQIRQRALTDPAYVATWLRIVLSLPIDKIGFKAMVSPRQTPRGGNKIYFQTCVPAKVNGDEQITNFESVVSSAAYQYDIYTSRLRNFSSGQNSDNNTNNNNNNTAPPPPTLSNTYLQSLSGITLRQLLESPQSSVEFPFKSIFAAETTSGGNGVCSDDVEFTTTPCLPYVLPGSYAAPVLLLVVATLKDVAVMIIGFTILDQRPIRALTTKLTALIAINVYPFTESEAAEWAAKAISRFDPRRIEMDSFWELMVRFFDQKLKDEWERGWEAKWNHYKVEGGEDEVVAKKHKKSADQSKKDRFTKQFGVLGQFFQDPDEAKHDPDKKNTNVPDDFEQLPIAVNADMLKQKLEYAAKVKEEERLMIASIKSRERGTVTAGGKVKITKRRRKKDPKRKEAAAIAAAALAYSPKGGEENEEEEMRNLANNNDQEEYEEEEEDDEEVHAPGSAAALIAASEKLRKQINAGSGAAIDAHPTKKNNNKKKLKKKNTNITPAAVPVPKELESSPSKSEPLLSQKEDNNNNNNSSANDDEYEYYEEEIEVAEEEAGNEKPFKANFSSNFNIHTGTFHEDSGFIFYDDLKPGETKFSSEAEIALFKLFTVHICKRRKRLILNPEEVRPLFADWIKALLSNDVVELFFERRELESNEEIALKKLLEASTEEVVALSGDIWEEKLTPPPWLILWSLLYGFINLIMLIVSTARTVTSISSWDLYNNIMFMYINSGTSIGTMNNAVMRRIFFGDWTVFDPFVFVSFLMCAPPLFTHIIPAAFMYCWLPISVVIACGLVYRFGMVSLKRYLERQAASQSKISSQLLFMNAMWRNLMVFVANVVMCALYNYMLLHYLEQEGELDLGGYWGVPKYEFNSRSLTCSLVSLAGQITNAMQLISGIWV